MNRIPSPELTREFYIPCDGIRLHAKLDLPSKSAAEAKLPLVLVIPGLTGHMEEPHIVAAAEALAENGGFLIGVGFFDGVQQRIKLHPSSQTVFDNIQGKAIIFLDHAYFRSFVLSKDKL